LVIAQGQRVAVIEIKTGDSTLPLPSSANAQMLILKDGARTRFEGAEVVPVLVTNYLVDDADRKELKDGGIQLLTIQSSTYDSEALSAKLEQILTANSDSPRGAPDLVTP
jgi:hypothetical protein